MSKIVVIDSDRRETRVVVLEREAASTHLRRAVSVVEEAGADLAGKVSTALAGESVSKARTAISVGRDQVQLKLMELPPAPAEELAEMVRFQAERDLGLPSADTPLDYVPLEGSEHERYRVLVTALARSGLDAARKLGKSIASEPAHVTLRAMAASSLLARWSEFDPREVSLLAIPLAEQAELVVVADGHPVLMRTIRLPPDGDDNDGQTAQDSMLQGPATDASLQGMIAAGLNPRDATLACEIRRTLAATHQQLRDRTVDVVYFAGAEQGRSMTTGLLSRQLRLRCETFDPLVVADANGVLGASDVEVAEPGRFAAALGLALDMAEKRPLPIDFLHPRRPVEKARVERVHILAAAAALVMVAVFGWWLYDQLAGTAAELADLRLETEERQQIVDQFADVEKQAREIEGWLRTDVNWLDELERLSRQWRPEPLDAEDFPAQTDAVMTLLAIKSSSGDEEELGQMTITAAGRSGSVIPPLESRLRDETHRVIGRVIEQDESVPGYPSRFEMDIDVLPTDEEGGALE